jgi:hypothetical protein
MDNSEWQGMFFGFASVTNQSQARAQNARGMDHSEWQGRFFGFTSVTNQSQTRIWHGASLQEGFREIHPAISVAHYLEVMHC